MRSLFVPPLRASRQLLAPPTLISRPLSASTKLPSQNSGPKRPQPAPRNNSNELKFWPFAAILVAGTGLFTLIVRQREGTGPTTGNTRPIGPGQ